MKTITVINQKGGVGKSTTALAVGAGLTLHGYAVLYIDLDAQGNLSFVLGADTTGYNALGVLQRPETVNAEVRHLGEAGDIIASSPALAVADATLTATGKEYRLKEALQALKGKYDYCIVDTPPALGILTVNALTAATGAIIPAQADIFSLQGIGQLGGTLDAVKKYCNPDLSVMGILLTRYNDRAVIGREAAEMTARTAGQLGTKLFTARIRECTAIKEAQARRQSIYSYAPKSNAAADYAALVAEIMTQEEE